MQQPRRKSSAKQLPDVTIFIPMPVDIAFFDLKRSEAKVDLGPQGSAWLVDSLATRITKARVARKVQMLGVIFAQHVIDAGADLQLLTEPIAAVK